MVGASVSLVTFIIKVVGMSVVVVTFAFTDGCDVVAMLLVGDMLGTRLLQLHPATTKGTALWHASGDTCPDSAKDSISKQGKVSF